MGLTGTQARICSMMLSIKPFLLKLVHQEEKAILISFMCSRWSQVNEQALATCLVTVLLYYFSLSTMLKLPRG